MIERGEKKKIAILEFFFAILKVFWKGSRTLLTLGDALYNFLRELYIE